MNSNENKGFIYTYSAKDQAEIKRIRNKYTTDKAIVDTNKIEQVRRLDEEVSRKATAAALTLGIICTLIMGLGMSIIMTDIKETLGLLSEMYMIIGIAIGFFGMLGVISAYPLYQRVLAKERKKVAPEILRLMEEIIEN